MAWGITDTNKLTVRKQAFVARGVTVTYKQQLTESMDTLTGDINETTQDVIIKYCLVGELTDEDIAALAGDYILGDMVFRFLSPPLAVCNAPWNRLPETPPRNTAVILWGDQPYKVYKSGTSQDRLVYVAYAHPIPKTV